MAGAIYTLAGHLRVSRDEVLWHMHLAEVLMYQHCALRAAGFWTVAPEAPTLGTGIQLTRILAALADEEKEEL